MLKKKEEKKGQYSRLAACVHAVTYAFMLIKHRPCVTVVI